MINIDDIEEERYQQPIALWILLLPASGIYHHVIMPKPRLPAKFTLCLTRVGSSWQYLPLAEIECGMPDVVSNALTTCITKSSCQVSKVPALALGDSVGSPTPAQCH